MYTCRYYLLATFLGGITAGFVYKYALGVESVNLTQSNRMPKRELLLLLVIVVVMPPPGLPAG